MFIEHRTYTIKPGLVGAYLDDYGKSGWAVHSEHAPCMGHYYTEAGALFRIVSMWRYESFEDRLARRAELNARADWRDVMGRIAPLVTDIQSNLLVPSPCWVAGDWYLALFDHIDQMSMDGFLAGLTEDCTVTFGNQPTVKGRAEIRSAIGAFWASIRALKHRFVNVTQDGDDMTLEAQIDYTRLDGRLVTIPCATVLKRCGHKVRSMRIYIDVAPLYAKT